MASNSDLSSAAPPAASTRPPSIWARIGAYYEAHPALGNFWLLAPAMVVILLISIQGTPLEPTQRLAIVLATIGTAGACAWIIGQSEEDQVDPSP